MAAGIYCSVDDEIVEVLKEMFLAEYEDEVKGVCLDQLSQALRPLMLKCSGTETPGLAEMAIEDGARGFKIRLATSLFETLTELEKLAEERRAAAERERLIAEKPSRSWRSAIKEFLRW